jgi:hypothetical protein
MLTREQNHAIFGPSIRVFRIMGGAKIAGDRVSLTTVDLTHSGVLMPGGHATIKGRVRYTGN